MERIDKIIATQTAYSRKEVKGLIRKKKVKVNDIIISQTTLKVDTKNDKIAINDLELKIQNYVYLILNKPKGYISATIDKKTPTVLDLVPEKYKHRNLFPAGRLDKDTTGLMIITDDGDFAHEILSPKKHVPKTYNVTIMEDMFENFGHKLSLLELQKYSPNKIFFS